MIEIVEADVRHIPLIVADLRETTKRDFAYTDLTPRQVAWKCYRASFIRKTALVDGFPVAMWGCAGTLLGGHGEPWLLATNMAERYKRQLLRVVRREVDAMFSTFRNLGGIVNARSPDACRFLEHLGFKIGPQTSGDFRHYAGSIVHSHAPFVIFGLPRSRTAWLSKFLTYGGSKCHHDALLYLSNVAELKALLAESNVGLCETALGFAAPLIREMCPETKFVVVCRPIDQVRDSLAKQGWVQPGVHLEKEQECLDAISRMPGTLTVSFDDLETEECCEEVFEHCLGLTFDRAWWGYWSEQNVQIDMDARKAESIERTGAIREFRAEAMSAMRHADIQEETWESFYRDGQALFREHYAEVGEVHNLPYEPNFELASRMYDLGMLQIMTARHAGEMVGYLVFQIEPCFESKNVKRGIQTIFFVKPQFRGNLGLRLHAASRKALTENGIRLLTLRSGIRGVGERQEVLFKRLGARNDGHMFSLVIG